MTAVGSTIGVAATGTTGVAGGMTTVGVGGGGGTTGIGITGVGVMTGVGVTGVMGSRGGLITVGVIAGGGRITGAAVIRPVDKGVVTTWGITVSTGRTVGAMTGGAATGIGEGVKVAPGACSNGACGWDKVPKRPKRKGGIFPGNGKARSGFSSNAIPRRISIILYP
jgi:hypothetical protein